jgi:cytoskeletal protein RodZ
MTHAFRWRAARLLLAPAMLTATLAWAAPEVSAQNTQPAQTQPQTQTQTQTTNQNKPAQPTTAQPATQTQTQTQTTSPPATQQQPTAQTPAASQTTAAQTQTTSAPADEPLYREFKGVRIGTSQSEARKKLGNPEVKSKEMDIFVLSDKQRARVVYDASGNAVAVAVTYIGKNGDIPAPKSVLGTEADAKPDGSIYKIVYYPKAGYWVAYSRTAGDEPLTIITMQKMANAQ